MKLAAGRFNSVLCTLFLMPFVGVPALAGEPTQPKVNGTLSEIDGVPILRVWGTAEEQGFAQGFLLGPDIVRFLDGFLSSGTILDVEGYRNRILPRLGLMKIQPPYEAELRAMLRGIEARTGGPAIVSAL